MSRGHERRGTPAPAPSGDRRATDRRSSKRIPVEMWVEERSDHELYFQHATNLSEGGLFLERTVPRPTGTIVTLEFALPGEDGKLRVRGEIVNSGAEGEDLGMGVRFVELDDTARLRIRAFIARESAD